MSGKRRALSTLTVEIVKSLLAYDPETGVFTWLVDRGGHSRRGAVAGCVIKRKNNQPEYRRINVASVQCDAHRLAWFYTYGHWPEVFIDHKNGDGLDNRITNLRDCTQRVNAQNLRSAKRGSSSGLLGVRFSPKTSRVRPYMAEIRIAGRKKHLGMFESAEAAYAAYVAAKRVHHEGCTL